MAEDNAINPDGADEPSLPVEPVDSADEADDEVATPLQDPVAAEAADDEADIDEILEDELVDEDEELIEEGEIAGDYLEALLDILDFDGDIDLDVEGDRAIVSIDGGKDLTKLVGRKGEVLDALQELTRLAVQQATGERSRLMLDIAGWRAAIRADLTQLGIDSARKVVESGEPLALRSMTPFERKVVHDAVSTVSGVTTDSEGAEPHRHVVIVKV
jgi:spoIIIJ-associated protein